MEPVPETERMEEFRSSPIPTLSLNSPSLLAVDFEVSRKLPAVRRGIDPSSPSPSSWYTSNPMAYRPRTASPLSASHSRSQSSGNLGVGGTGMSRTKSLPGVNGAGHILYSPQLRPASPSQSPARVRTPKRPADEGFPLTSPVRTSVLEPSPRRSSSERSLSPSLGLPPSSSTPRLRRTSSPFRSLPSPALSSTTQPSSPSPSASSPLYKPYDYAYSSYSSALSSIPSTPTSTRSRSPSISSLETIPDTPDAEEAALEAERQAQIAAANDSGSDSGSESKRDVPSRGRTLAYGPRDKRKRWSVCGAERRSDLDLETIWED